MPLALAAICAGTLVVASASFAANDGSRGAPGVQAGQAGAEDIETLLRRVEQQIITGHAVAPAEESAMETWQHVLELRRASPDSPKVLTALAGFAARMRGRADDEKKGGRLVVSGDLIVFADQATRLLGHTYASTFPAPDLGTARSRLIPDIRSPDVAGPLMLRSRDFAPFDSLSRPLPAPPVPIPSEPQAIGVTTGQSTAAVGEHKVPLASPTTKESETGTPATGRTNVDAARPMPASINPAETVTVTAAPPAVTALAPPSTAAAPVRQDPPGSAFFAKRGDEMMAIKDITAARRFYEYAANAGNAHAATALAWTFDEGFATELGVLGLKPDPVLAATWYRKAAELGSPGAAARLRSLQSNEAAVK